jgi:hypothetical protein
MAEESSLRTCDGLNGITMHIGCFPMDESELQVTQMRWNSSRLNSCDLTLRLRAFFQLRHLLTWLRRCRNFVTENNVSDFAGGQRHDIDTVALAEILS